MKSVFNLFKEIGLLRGGLFLFVGCMSGWLVTRVANHLLLVDVVTGKSEWCFVNHIASVERGDKVVVEKDGEIYCNLRVCAMPGDTICMENGTVYKLRRGGGESEMVYADYDDAVALYNVVRNTPMEVLRQIAKNAKWNAGGRVDVDSFLKLFERERRPACFKVDDTDFDVEVVLPVGFRNCRLKRYSYVAEVLDGEGWPFYGDTISARPVNNNRYKLEEFVVPYKGMCVEMNERNVALYGAIILEYESSVDFKIEREHLMRGGLVVDEYCFGDDYYFVMPDNRTVFGVVDSRRDGPVCCDRIIGTE